ncbi:hypothetical protein U1Q18_023984 [Sarracenia purpurea var. burkii]
MYFGEDETQAKQDVTSELEVSRADDPEEEDYSKNQVLSHLARWVCSGHAELRELLNLGSCDAKQLCSYAVIGWLWFFKFGWFSLRDLYACLMSAARKCFNQSGPFIGMRLVASSGMVWAGLLGVGGMPALCFCSRFHRNECTGG